MRFARRAAEVLWKIETMMNEAEVTTAPAIRWRREAGALIAAPRGVLTASRMLGEIRGAIIRQLEAEEARAVVIDFRGAIVAFSGRQMVEAPAHCPLFGRAVIFLILKEQMPVALEYSELMSELYGLSRPVFLQQAKALQWAQSARRVRPLS